jgi:TorA maturation chaperone TorD
MPVWKFLPVSRSALNVAYERTFGLLSSCACPPCEADYIDGTFSYQRSQTLGDVGGFYRAFGLQPSRSHPERHDHIVLELEFMAFVLGLERRALETCAAETAETVDLCRRAQQRFLNEHVAWWAPAFARLLGREDAGGFYDAAGVFLAALIAAERALLVVPPPSHLGAPSLLERPEECDGCQLTC